MSFDFRTVREPSNDPVLKYITNLQKTMQKFLTKDAVDQLEGAEDIFGDVQDVDSAIQFQTGLSHTHKFYFDKDYYTAIDPGTLVPIWLRGYSMGQLVSDFSEYVNDDAVWAVGEPKLVDGYPFDPWTFDESVGVKSIALRFNRSESEELNEEHIGIGDWHTISSRFSIRNATSGRMTYFFRVRTLATNLQGGERRTLLCKIDNTGANNAAIEDAIRVSIDPINKRWVVQTKYNGVFSSKETGANEFVENKVYDCFITHDAGTVELWTGEVSSTGVETPNMTRKTLVNSGYTEQWSEDKTSTEIRLFKRGVNADDGHFKGDLYDWKIYDSKILTSNSSGISTGTCYKFDGVNDWLDCGNHTDLWSKALSKFSWVLDIFPTISGDTNRDIMRHGSSGGGRFRADINQTDGDVKWYIRNNADTSDGTARSDDLLLNQWNRIVGTYDNSLGADNVKVYVNGNIGYQMANLTDTINLSAIMSLSGSTTDFAGYMKDFHFWDNIALNQTQVTLLQSNRFPLTREKYWITMREGTGLTVDQMLGKTVTSNGVIWQLDEMGNHWINKYSISAIPRGCVDITNHEATRMLAIPSYSSTSYTQMSYNT